VPRTALTAQNRGPERLYGAIEGGGTKFVCAIAAADGEIKEQTRIPTTSPAETLASCILFFESMQRQMGALTSLGIGCFGPLDLNVSSPNWGCMLPTPKAGWSGTNLVAPFLARFKLPVAIDTDVNAAAIAEACLGAGKGCASLAYVTVGTGVGGGAVVNGATLRGLPHPEMGHLRVSRHPHDLSFSGICPFHGDCLEGLASGAAIRARWGAPLNEVSDTLDARNIIGSYLGQLAAAIVLVLASERIIFGGGVMRADALLQYIRQHAQTIIRDYPATQPLDARILAPGLGEQSGIIGAVMLAMQAAQSQPRRQEMP
jgi:fructokinase